MPKAAPKPEREHEGLTGLSFEAALEKLESIVAAMEGNDLALEAMLARYEEGVKLVEACQKQLASAEVRVRQLEEKNLGGAELKPLELGMENNPGSRSGDRPASSGIEV